MNQPCGGCNQPVSGRMITALGKKWHLEHFVCNSCKGALGTKTFYEKDGMPYCDQCYPTLFSPKCAYCQKPVLEKCLTALDQSWHPEHFFCTSCKKTFDDIHGFHEKENKPYCSDCFHGSFGPKCATCNSTITDSYITALNRQWHANCFVCQECRQPFEKGSFYEHNGLPYCELHYHVKMGLVCAKCMQPVRGRCVNAMGQKFHPEHFVCAQCEKQLTKSGFHDVSGRPYCEECVKLQS
jgi:paxillin